jgi:hypothetical protein
MTRLGLDEPLLEENRTIFVRSGSKSDVEPSKWSRRRLVEKKGYESDKFSIYCARYNQSTKASPLVEIVVVIVASLLVTALVLRKRMTRSRK